MDIVYAVVSFKYVTISNREGFSGEMFPSLRYVGSLTGERGDDMEEQIVHSVVGGGT